MAENTPNSIPIPTAPAEASTGLFSDASHTIRCAWCRVSTSYQHYHDNEWGFPVKDERRLFEKICL